MTLKTPLIAGLAAGILFVVLFTILPIPGYPLLSERVFPPQRDADYTPLLQLRITDLRDSYKVGEGVDFAVRQIAGGGCVLPELIIIKDLNTGEIIREWNGTSANVSPFCRVITNPATQGTTWTTKTAEENPIIFNQTGSYAVVAKHLFVSVQKEFDIIEVGDNGNDTSPEVVDVLLSRSSESETLKALLQKYPDANVTATANFYSKMFQEFEKYDPAGIVQYSVDNTDSGKDRALTASVIFDRYYENSGNMPLIHIKCSGENYTSISVGEGYIAPSKIGDC